LFNQPLKIAVHSDINIGYFRMVTWKASVVRALARSALVTFAAIGFAAGPWALAGCGGSSAPARSPTPAAMNGLDVLVVPNVTLSGEGAREHGNFGDTLIGAMESRLLGDGFDVVPAGQEAAALRVQARANLSVSRSQFIMVNGKPLESSSALVQIRVVSADGSLIDAFEVSGDADVETAGLVATNLAERLKKSRRVLAIAQSPLHAPARKVAAAEVQRSGALTADEVAERRRTQIENAMAIRQAASAVQLEEDGIGSEPTSQTVVTASAPAPAKRFVGSPQSNAYALVVGVEKYRDLPAPPGAASDAYRFQKLLTTTLGVRSENIRMAVDAHATRSDLENHLKWLKDNVPEKGRIYFYFAGHGAPEPEKETTFLMPFDGDAKDPAGTALSMRAVVQSLSETRAEVVLAIVDACFTGDSGRGGRSVQAPGLRALQYKRKLPEAAKVALFTASSADQTSGAFDGSGLFTSQLVQGLSTGKADFDEDGSVTLQELSTYVETRVKRLAQKHDKREQTPTLTFPKALDPAQVLVVWGLPTAK
jgi:uncharacterized caspase-like protein